TICQTPGVLSPEGCYALTDGRSDQVVVGAPVRHPYVACAPEIPMTDTASRATKSFSWRTPLILILCACSISVLTFGPRSSLGFFLTPLSQANGWGRDVFALSLALQNLLWGLGQPFAGAIADKYGAPRVLSAGVILYALGLYLTSSANTPGLV